MTILLAQEAAAGAAGADPGAAAAGPGLLVQLFPFLLIFFVMWFLVIRPQRKQEKERQARVSALKRGDRVKTRGGIIAPVVRVKEDVVVVALGGDRSVEVEIHKGYVEEVLSADGKSDARGDGK